MATTVSIADPPIDLCLLGPLQVTVDGLPVPVGGPRQMAVLARLMLTPDQVVTMDQLVESVWDGDEPARPHVAIRSYVSNLRRAIEPDRQRRSTDSCIASAPPGYRLALEPESVDWIRFERLVNDGRYQLSVGGYSAAVEKLEQADTLWKGDPCSGLPDSPTFMGARGRLIKLREAAIELLFEALLHRGDHAVVAAEVESAIAENPLRERLTELGMMAFYRSGRQSEALGLGQQLRTRLLEELGIDPSPAIEAIELKILNHDRSLDPPASHHQSPSQSDQQSLDRHEAVLQDAIITQDLGPARSEVWANTGDLELRAAFCAGEAAPVGRTAELAALRQVGVTLKAGRSTTAILTGEQGIGKTSVVRSAAAELTDDGVVVAWSRCVPDGGGPLWPWAQAVLALLEARSDDPPVEISADLVPLAALGPSVAGALGLRSDAVADLPRLRGEADGAGEQRLDGLNYGGARLFPRTGDQEFDRAEVMLAVTRLLGRLAKTAPIGLVFEDLQWADNATVSLLNYAASTLTDSPVAFVLTWRETDLGGGPIGRSLRELWRLPSVLRIELEGLDVAAVSDLAESIGRPLPPSEAEVVHARCGGNPLFIREVLVHPDSVLGEGRRWSTLADAVNDWVARINPAAPELLSGAAILRGPFSAESLLPLSSHDRPSVQGVLNAAVRGGMLNEDESAAGGYRFRHGLVAEVLGSELLAVDRAEMHRSTGRHLAANGGTAREVAFHLSRSLEPADRVSATRRTLSRLSNEFDTGWLSELDDIVDRGMAAAQQLGQDGEDPSDNGFVIDVLNYSSWRAAVDGRPVEWVESATEALRAATAAYNEANNRSNSRNKTAVDPNGRIMDRLNVAVMNIIGSPLFPIGPTRTAGFVSLSPDVLEELNNLAEHLPSESLARWMIQVHMAGIAAGGKPGLAAQSRAVRDVQKTVTGARRRLGTEEGAVVQMAMIARFADSLDQTTRLTAISEVEKQRPGLSSSLFAARYGYPALLELGRGYEAETLVARTLALVTTEGDGLQLAEARLLWIRHLLWAGRLDGAEEELTRALAAWSRLGLSEPVPLVRQRRMLRLLQQRPPEASRGADGHHQLLTDRAHPPELAVRLARLGHTDLAVEHLETSLQRVTLNHPCLQDLALIAVGAGLLGHEKAALTVYDLLTTSGDQLVVRGDGSTVLGPASLYAGLAAQTAGLDEGATSQLDEAMTAVKRAGGSSTSLNIVVNHLGQVIGSN